MKSLIAILTLSCAAFAQQQGTPVTTTNYPHDAPSLFLDYDGNGNDIYNCYAKPVQNYIAITGNSLTQQFQWTFAASTLTNIIVSANVGTATTSTAHGLQVGNLVTVGGSATTALNASYYVQTVPSITTFTITTTGVGNATYTTGLVVGTQAPLLTQPIWSIQKLTYNGSNKLTNTQWALGTAGSYKNICSNRAVTTGATMITYQ